MNSREDILEKIKQMAVLITEDETEMDEESTLMDDLGLNSIQILSFISLIEREYKMKFGPRDISNLETLGDVADYVQNHG